MGVQLLSLVNDWLNAIGVAIELCQQYLQWEAQQLMPHLVSYTTVQTHLLASQCPANRTEQSTSVR